MWATIRDGAIGALETALTFLHDLVSFTEPHAWGWAIILLTLVIRVLLLPLAIKQTRSMRAMQALQPQMKELQKKYKVDRELLKKDPETYRAKKQKLNEEMMALYQREGANPAASCLPLLAQAPIFLALFWTLQRGGRQGGALRGADAQFYFFTPDRELGLAAQVAEVGWPGWLLIVLMAGTMFWSQRQMLARTALTQGADADANPMAQQQKILMYVMPVFLAVISFRFPLGILLYWVTTNFWQVAQQAIILREVKHEAETGTLGDHRGGEAAKRPDPKGQRTTGPSKGATSGTKKGPSTDGSTGAGPGKNGKRPATPPADQRRSKPRKSNTTPPSTARDHLPRRGRGERT